MKRKLITFRRLAFSGVQNFFRNSWLSVAATAVMIVALTIILERSLLTLQLGTLSKSCQKTSKFRYIFKTV